MSWALWIALAALLAGAGKFLDDYHISKKSKSAARDALVRWFVWLDEQRIPDLGSPLLALASKLFKAKKMWLVLFALILAYISTTSAFYIGRSIYGPPNTLSYLDYVLSWLFIDDDILFWTAYLSALAIPAVAGLALIAYCFHRAALGTNALVQAALLLLGVLGSATICMISAVIMLAVGQASAYTPSILVYASASSILIPSIFAALTAALILARLATRFAQTLLLQIFDVASNPEKSPYTYASSLVGVLILAIKLLQELATAAFDA